MSALAVTPEYSQLLVRFPPRVIRNEEQNEAYTAILEDLDSHCDTWTAEEEELADLLTLLIEDFEEKHYSMPKAPPEKLVEFLLDQNAMTVVDLGALLGSHEAAQAILAGDRELTKDDISRLSTRFHISPESFF